MTVLHPSIDVVRGTLAEPLVGAVAGLRERTFMVLRLTHEDGTVGLGEASPLPGYSPDSIEEAMRELQRLDSGPLRVDRSLGPAELLDEAFRTHHIECPSARFAFETALLDWSGKTRDQPLHQMLGDDVAREPIPIADLVLEPDPSLWPSRVDRLCADGATNLKFKIGFQLVAELDALRAIRAAHPALAIRLDANRRVPIEELRGHASVFESLDVELIEEPVAPEDWPQALALPLPFALDETLWDETESKRLLEEHPLRAVVLKPTVLGGMRTAIELAERARSKGADVVVSHTFDGPIARAAMAELSLALRTELAAGLGAHPALGIWPAHRIAAVRGRQIESHGSPGLGLHFEEGIDA